MKPTKHTKAPVYDYNECAAFINEKYSVNIDDFAGMFSAPSKEGDFERYVRITGDVYPYPPGQSPDTVLVGPQEATGYRGWRQIDDKWERCSLTEKEYKEHWRLIHEQFARSQEWLKGNETPYQNFWHWVIDNHEVNRGGSVYFDRDEIEDINEDWVRQIYSWFIEEFADEDGSLEMETDW